jgi:hypothetical protein
MSYNEHLGNRTYYAEAIALATKAPVPQASVSLCVLVAAVIPKPTKLIPPITAAIKGK